MITTKAPIMATIGVKTAMQTHRNNKHKQSHPGQILIPSPMMALWGTTGEKIGHSRSAETR